MSAFWSWVVIVGTVGSIAFFYVLLHMNRSGTRSQGETTGHNYDGIEEYDNPLPAWWYWMFVITIIYGLLYLAWYPGLGNFEGFGGWTSHGELEADRAESQAKYEPLYARYSAIPVEELHQVPAAKKMGQRLFSNNCSACHGSAAAGGSGFPDLTDGAWIWGGTGIEIEQSILNGRAAAMPAWKGALPEESVADVASYVISLSGRQEESESVAKGKAVFDIYCAACHGPDGQGNKLLGAADLTDGVWLYGNSRARIKDTISNGRSGTMPGFKDKLGESKVHVLAGYVYGLSL